MDMNVPPASCTAGSIAVIAWVENNNFIICMDTGLNGTKIAMVAPGNGDLRDRIELELDHVVKLFGQLFS